MSHCVVIMIDIDRQIFMKFGTNRRPVEGHHILVFNITKLGPCT
jgi:hypothetical protein